MQREKHKGNGDGFLMDEPHSLSSLLGDLPASEDAVLRESLSVMKATAAEALKLGTKVFEKNMETIAPVIKEYKPEYVAEAEIEQAKIRAEVEKFKAQLEFTTKLRETEVKKEENQGKLLVEMWKQKITALTAVQKLTMDRMQHMEERREKLLRQNVDNLRNFIGYISKSKRMMARMITEMEMQNYERGLREEEARILHEFAGLLHDDLSHVRERLPLALEQRTLPEPGDKE